MNVDLLSRAAIEIGIRLQGPDQLDDACGAFIEAAQKALPPISRGEHCNGRGKPVRTELGGKHLDITPRQAKSDD